MIYLLFGEDTYQIKEEADKIKERFLKEAKNGEIVSFRLAEKDAGKIKNALMAASFI